MPCHASLLAGTKCVCTQTAVASKLRQSYINGTAISSTVGHLHGLLSQEHLRFSTVHPFRRPSCPDFLCLCALIDFSSAPERYKQPPFVESLLMFLGSVGQAYQCTVLGNLTLASIGIHWHPENSPLLNVSINYHRVP